MTDEQTDRGTFGRPRHAVDAYPTDPDDTAPETDSWRAGHWARHAARNAARAEEVLLDSEATALQQARLDRERAEQLTPERLAARKGEMLGWLTDVQRYQPRLLTISLGDKAEMIARATHQAWAFTETDARHPDGSVLVLGERAGEGETRAYPTERVLAAIRDLLLVGSFSYADCACPPPPPPAPLTLEQRLAAMVAERERRAELRRRPGFNPLRPEFQR